MQVNLLLRKYPQFWVLMSVFILLLAVSLSAQTSGKISGRIIDAETGDPLPGVNVILIGTNIGSSTNLDGNYNIVNVPVGLYDVQATMMGYERMTQTDAFVALDRITKLNFNLKATILQGQEVVVVAEKEIMYNDVSNSQQIISQDQIVEAAGVRNLKDFLTNQAGITDEEHLEIRGGSRDQTGAIINGLTFVDAGLGRAQTTVPLSAVEQVSVLTGGFNAEYGNFRSGLINMITKSGTRDSYHGQINFSMNNGDIKRFGKSAYDPYNWLLRSYFDPEVAFVGTSEGWADDPYKIQQSRSWRGWNTWADRFNKSADPEKQVTPLDLYLATAWMHQTVPDFDALEEAGYTVPADLQKKLKDHANPGEGAGSDWQIDGGFGGPVPFIGKSLGNATFYLSNQTSRNYYIQPVIRDNELKTLTMLTVKSNITDDLSVKLNGMYRKMYGVSGIRNASTNDSWGGGDAEDRGGLMPVNNLGQWVGNGVNYWNYPTYHTAMDITTKMVGITLNHVISPKTYWDLTASYYVSGNKTHTDETRDRTILANFGPIQVDEMPYGRINVGGAPYYVGDWEWNQYSQPMGVDDRFSSKGGELYDRSKEQQFRLKWNLGSQFNDYNYFKAGIEYSYFDLNMWQWKDWPGFPGNTYEFTYDRQPWQFGSYLQDQITFNNMIANLGLRLDYYNGGNKGWPSGDPWAQDAWMGLDDATVQAEVLPVLASGESWIWNQLDNYAAENPGFYEDVKSHLTLSPRLGVSFPVTERSKIYFNYGHFRSTVPYSAMYLIKYRQASKNLIMELGNPNLEPPRTIAYELGVDYNLLDEYLIHIAGFYKDITGQHGDVQYRNTSGILHYDYRANNSYEDIQGVELTVTKRVGTWFSGWLNFRYMLVKNGLVGRQEITEETVNNAQEGLYQGQESRPKPKPDFAANIMLHTPGEWGPRILGNHIFGDWGMSILPVWRKGDYFTWNPLAKLHVENNLIYPDYYMVDFRLSKRFKVKDTRFTFYVDVENIFNIKVSHMSRQYAFFDNTDFNYYLRSLHLPMYDSPEFEGLREKNEGLYVAGNDKVGDLRSDDKPYIDDPNISFLLYGEKRQIWFGIKMDF